MTATNTTLEFAPFFYEDKLGRCVSDVLQSLINDTLEPHPAASEITGIAVAECEAEFTLWCDAQERRALEPEGFLGPRSVEETFWRMLAYSAEQVPADHSAQDKLVLLLLEMQKLPKTKLRNLLPDGAIESSELWTPLGSWSDWTGMGEWFRRIDESDFNPHEMQQSAASRQRYVNYSAYVARLLANSIIDTTRVCALTNSAFHSARPTDPKLHIATYEAAVFAAAEWIFKAGAATFEICEKSAATEPQTLVRWRDRSWREWKARFETVASTRDRFTDECCTTAWRAVTQMQKIQAEGMTTDVVTNLKMTSIAFVHANDVTDTDTNSNYIVTGDSQ